MTKVQLDREHKINSIATNMKSYIDNDEDLDKEFWINSIMLQYSISDRTAKEYFKIAKWKIENDKNK